MIISVFDNLIDYFFVSRSIPIGRIIIWREAVAREEWQTCKRIFATVFFLPTWSRQSVSKSKLTISV